MSNIPSVETNINNTNPIHGAQNIINTTPGNRTKTRKIGNCTFIVSSSVKEGKQKDIVSTIARLIQSENITKPGA